MHPVIMICYNNLELTRAAVGSVLAQDIPVELHLIDNGSTDGTWDWFRDLITFCPNVHTFRYEENKSPVSIANAVLKVILPIHGYALGVPNDIRLPANAYRQMLRWPRGFICASDNGHSEPVVREATAVSENTPMAVALIRRWFHDAIVARDGYFWDENFTHYASDCDMALRMASCGIRGVQLDVPFWHYGSATWRMAPEEDKRRMLAAADEDRAYFIRKWGFPVDDYQYGALAGDINFRGIPSTGTPQKPAGDMSTGEPEHTR